MMAREEGIILDLAIQEKLLVVLLKWQEMAEFLKIVRFY